MADDLFRCPECGRETEYYSTRKRRDPRKTNKMRIICGECYVKIMERAKGKK